VKKDGMMDAADRLKKIVENTGEVHSVYGGFEIKVLEPSLFPWYKVVDQLLEIGQDIWMNKQEGKIWILSEPEVR
jgi:hypothetical protein